MNVNVNVIILPGDGYKKQMLKPFMSYLSKYGIHPVFIQLLENRKACSYDDLETDNYMEYINSRIPSSWKSFVIYSISKGCHWARVYASKYPNKVKRLILVEPTTFNQQLMLEYEKSRGNDFIEDFYRIDAPFKGIDSTMKSLDVLVSDSHKYIPRGVPTIIIYTSRNNENKPYSADVYRMKREFVKYLRSNGCLNTTVHWINSHHCADLYDHNWMFLRCIIDGSK